eukprot:scaffold2229_cov255-Amphora_coffeaeformis.AAC.6
MVQRQESTRTAKQWECRMMMCVSLHAHVVDVDDDAIRHLKQPNGPGGWDDEWWLPHIPSVCVGRKNRRWFPPKKGDRKNRFIAPAGEHACARLPAALARENTFLELIYNGPVYHNINHLSYQCDGLDDDVRNRGYGVQLLELSHLPPSDVGRVSFNNRMNGLVGSHMQRPIKQ